MPPKIAASSPATSRPRARAAQGRRAGAGRQRRRPAPATQGGELEGEGLPAEVRQRVGVARRRVGEIGPGDDGAHRQRRGRHRPAPQLAPAPALPGAGGEERQQEGEQDAGAAQRAARAVEKGHPGDGPRPGRRLGHGGRRQDDEGDLGRPLLREPRRRSAGREGEQRPQQGHRAGEAGGVHVWDLRSPIGAELGAAEGVGRHVGDQARLQGGEARRPRRRKPPSPPGPGAAQRGGPLSDHVGARRLWQVESGRQQEGRGQRRRHRPAGRPAAEQAERPAVAAGPPRPQPGDREGGGESEGEQLGLRMAGHEERPEGDGEQDEVPPPSPLVNQDQSVDQRRGEGEGVGVRPAEEQEKGRRQAVGEGAGDRRRLAHPLTAEEEEEEDQGDEQPQRRDRTEA